MTNVPALLKNLWTFICAIAIFLTGLLGLGEAHKGTDELELINTNKYVMIDGFVAGTQGITTDGEYYYCSAAFANLKIAALSKIDMTTGEILNKKIGVIPKEFLDKDYDHIGDISYAEVNGEGLLYCPLENLDDNADHIILIFDTDLNYTGRYAYMRSYEITEDMGASLPANERPDEGQFLCDGLPWCAADSENGKLYCSRFRGADRLYVYDLETLTYLYDLPITGTEPLNRIQGASVYNGYLYVNIDHSTADGEKNRIIGKIDLVTGAYETAFVRPIFGLIDWESEGIVVFEKDGDTYITIGDYDHTVACYIHEYKVVKS